MARGTRLDRITPARTSLCSYPGLVTACLALILMLLLGVWSAPSARAAEGNAGQMHYTGTISVLNKPVPVYGLDSARVEIEVAGDTVSVTVEFVLVAVLKWNSGHMDVTNSATGKTVALTDKQMTLALDGAISPAGSFTQEQWDQWVQASGLEDMQPLSPEEREAVWSQAAPATTGTIAATTGFSQTTAISNGMSRSSPGSTSGTLSGGMLALIIVLAVVVAAAVCVGVILPRRGRHRA